MVRLAQRLQPVGTAPWAKRHSRAGGNPVVEVLRWQVDPRFRGDDDAWRYCLI